jgi:hypothetical protein
MKRFDSAKAFRERLEKRKATRAAAAEAAEARAREAEERSSIRKQLELERELARFTHRETITDCGPLGDVDVVTTFRRFRSSVEANSAGSAVQRPPHTQRAMLAGLALALCGVAGVPNGMEAGRG